MIAKIIGYILLVVVAISVIVPAAKVADCTLKEAFLCWCVIIGMVAASITGLWLILK